MRHRVEVPAYAKINLGLRVLGKRADGYHNLETFFLQIDLADRVSFAKSSRPGLAFRCNWTDIGDPEANLCVRACRVLEQSCGVRLNVDVHLEKRIPHGAGLGGGSSDAAVTLLALNEMFALGLSAEQLGELAIQVGSDVPFFLHGGLAYATGRGEQLEVLDYLPPGCILIVQPELSISTRWVFENLKIGLTNIEKNTTLASLKNSLSEPDKLRDVCRNELETIVFSGYPELAEIKSRLQDAGASPVSMSGSGSAIFGFFVSPHALREGVRVVGTSYRTFATRPIRSGMQQIHEVLAASTSGG